MVKQLNIFVENKPGRIKSITEVLENESIDIKAFAIQDRGDFGLVKFLVDEPEKAYLALLDKGFAAALKDVVVVSVKNKVGNLHKLSTILLKHKVNVADTYGFVIESEKRGICCIDLADGAEKIEKILAKEGFTVLKGKTIKEL